MDHAIPFLRILFSADRSHEWCSIGQQRFSFLSPFPSPPFPSLPLTSLFSFFSSSETNSYCSSFYSNLSSFQLNSSFKIHKILIFLPIPTPFAFYTFAGNAALIPNNSEKPGMVLPCSTSPFWLPLSLLTLHLSGLLC